MRCMKNCSTTIAAHPSTFSLAGILNNLDKEDSSQIFQYLAAIKPKDAEAI